MNMRRAGASIHAGLWGSKRCRSHDAQTVVAPVTRAIGLGDVALERLKEVCGGVF